MEKVYMKIILETYKMFSKRQRVILESLAKTKEVYTFDDLQKILQEDKEAKEILSKIRLIVKGEHEKAGVYKSTSNSKPACTEEINEIELMM